ncbi:LIM domain only protein 7-like isoform X4 [Antennarius striatus]|uniref:LIM domain only protein 7-like isoform X4 n=1 Tax=Antennarius striatus TaxID=241820 RepID=UPI0035AFCB95
MRRISCDSASTGSTFFRTRSTTFVGRQSIAGKIPGGKKQTQVCRMKEQAVTKKTFGTNNFRSALENGVLLCELINKIKPGIIKRINRLPTPIAGLDNLNVFLKACGKLGLKEAQLFHPGDLQDLSTRVTVKLQETNRRLKNVLITIYWLGRRAQCDNFYDGPYLNFKAFEGLLGTALYKALQETSSQRGSNVRDSGFGDSWCSEREEFCHLRGQGEEGRYKRDNSLDSLDSLGSRPHSISSDATLKGSSEGGCSDNEVDSVLRMADSRDAGSYRRSISITPKSTTQFNQFLPTKDKPSGYVPAPLRRKRAERTEESRRSWANPSYSEEESTLTRPQQIQESFDGSKSASDIQVDPEVIRQSRYEEIQKYRDYVKSSESQWQDDLSKWKNRRRSVNSDIVKKKEEREKIEQITHSVNRRSRTFKEMQEDRENKFGHNSLSYLEDEDTNQKPAISPRSRTFLPRHNTIDTPYHYSEPPEPSLKVDKPLAASEATRRVASLPPSRDVNAVDIPAGRDATITSSSSSSLQRCPVATPSQSNPFSEHTNTVKTNQSITTVSSSSAVKKVPESRPPLSGSQGETEAPSSVSLYKQPQLSSMEPKPPGVSRVSASLPRSYQRSDSARITSVVTPRPFGTQTSHITSLPRAFTMDDSQKGVNGGVSVSNKSSVPSRYHQFMTSEDEAQSSSVHSSEDEEEEEEEETEDKGETKVRSITSTQSISSVSPLVMTDAPVLPAPTKETSQENHHEMRISLNQKPNSSRDFGFQAAWDSTGARVTSIQPGSQAEMCQLHDGDEVLTVNRHQVADMSYTDWKACMEEALQEGSLVMDIRRHGKRIWDRDQPSLLFKSHKTINLTSTDHPILLGSPDTSIVNSSLDLTSHSPRERLPSKDSPAYPIIDVASNGVRGSFSEETLSIRNKGGSEPVMPDIPVPSIAPSVSRWSWDPEEERKRQEKWQKEQERLLQEKYKRDQEKLQEEWLKAQQEINRTVGQPEPGILEVNSHRVSPHSPLSPLGKLTPSPWEEEERKRKEEQEQELKRLAEERKKRQEEEELRRLQEERKRREEEEEEERKRKEKKEEEERKWKERQEEERKRIEEERKRKVRQEEEERKKREEEELRWQRRREEERRQQEAAEQQRREQERAFELQQWAGGPHGVANVPPTLSLSDRAKSKSSPQLDEVEKPPSRVTGHGMMDRKSQEPLSQAEAERLQILNEMKKKTPLLTDSSWIRQRSSSTAAATKPPNVPPMRRGDSLDNLDSYNSWRSSWTPRSNPYVQNYSRPHSSLSAGTSFYSGGLGTQQSGSSTLPSSYSTGSIRDGAGTPSSPWSRQSSSPSLSSPSPTPSPEPRSDALPPRSRSVSGKKTCTFCEAPLGKGAAMIIESLGLCYHLGCFKCIYCKSDLGGSEAGAEVRIRNKQLYCNSCYMQFKIGQPTSM